MNNQLDFGYNYVTDEVYWSRENIPEIRQEWDDGMATIDFKDESGGQAGAVMATSYALLVYLRNNRLKESEEIMMWLQTQRNTDGAFGSTQVGNGHAKITDNEPTWAINSWLGVLCLMHYAGKKCTLGLYW